MLSRSGRSCALFRSRLDIPLIAAVLFTIGLAAVACAVVSHHYPSMSPRDRADFHPLEVNLVGVQLARLAIGVLGILVITAEYSTGMIRALDDWRCRSGCRSCWGQGSGLRARHGRASMVPAVLIAFFIVTERSCRGTTSTRRSPIRASHVRCFGAALYLTVVGLFGLGLGAIVRNTAGGIAALRRDHVRAAAADERPAGELERRSLAVPAPRCR